MLAAVQKNNIKLAGAHLTRYSPTMDVIRQIIADGKIGDLLEIRARGKEHRCGGGEGLGPLAGTSVHAMYELPNGVKGYFASGKNRAPSRDATESSFSVLWVYLISVKGIGRPCICTRTPEMIHGVFASFQAGGSPVNFPLKLRTNALALL